MQEKVAKIEIKEPIKVRFGRKPSDPMQALVEARNRAHTSQVDLVTPIPVLNNVRPDKLPAKLTSYFVLAPHKDLPGIHTLKMTLREDNAALFGTLTVLVKTNGASIELYNAAYESAVRGCSPYAIRHFLAAFKDVKGLSFSTNEIYSQGVARPFANMGFQIVTMGTDDVIDLSALQKGEPLQHALAKLDFRKAPIKRLVFRRLGLGKPSRPRPAGIVVKPGKKPSAEAHKIS